MQKNELERSDELLAREFSFAADAVPDRGFSTAVASRIRRMRRIRQWCLVAAWAGALVALLWVAPSASWLGRAWATTQQQLGNDASLAIVLLVLCTVSLPMVLFSEDL